MPSFQEISPEKLNRLIGSPNAPKLIDVRTQSDFHSDPRLIPGAVRRDAIDVRELAASLGLSRMYSDDLEQLEAGMLLYDAFYRFGTQLVSRDHFP